jgi:hypothetical protein
MKDKKMQNERKKKRFVFSSLPLWCLLSVVNSYYPSSIHASEEKPFVEAEMIGQLGNNMFIVATTYALAWDNNAEAYFPELKTKYQYNWQNIPLNLSHIFFRCNLSSPPRKIAHDWHQPDFRHHPIPFHADMKIHGYVQSEKYFVHHRKRILELFAPHPDDLAYIQKKYQWLLDHPYTVGIQVRENYEEPRGELFIQYGKDYLRNAMRYFPKEALFVMFSNGWDFARENTPEEFADRVVCIENEPHYIDLFLLSFCKHNILTNSTFGWWGAWLNQNPEKIVVVPAEWMNPASGLPTEDVIPKDWVRIAGRYGPLNNPSTFK